MYALPVGAGAEEAQEGARAMTKKMQLWRFNAWSELHGTPQWFLGYLARILSVEVDLGTAEGERFSVVWKHEGKVWGSLMRGNRVLSGLTPHVMRLAAHYGLPIELRDARQRPADRIPWWSVSACWRPYQDEVHAAVMAEGCGVIDAPPRSGKTLMIARVIDTLAHPAVLIAPSVQIVRQTYEVFCKHFGEHSVARLDGDARPAQKDVSKSIVIATAASAVRQPKEWWDTRELLIIDEFHHAAAETYHRIAALAENAYYRLGFTGTHFRTGSDALAMEAICSRVVHRIDPRSLMPTYLAPAHVFFAPANAPGVSGKWHEAYQRGIVDSDQRNRLVTTIANTMSENGLPTIVLTRRRAHADYLGERIPNSVVVKGGENALTSRAVRDFLDGRYEVLVGTSVIGEGVDVPRASVLVFASGGADGVSMAQSYYRPLTAHPGKRCGRIYDFSDRHHRTLRRHSDRRAEMARSIFGADCVHTP